MASVRRQHPEAIGAGAGRGPPSSAFLNMSDNCLNAISDVHVTKI